MLALITFKMNYFILQLRHFELYLKMMSPLYIETSIKGMCQGDLVSFQKSKFFLY